MSRRYPHFAPHRGIHGIFVPIEPEDLEVLLEVDYEDEGDEPWDDDDSADGEHDEE